MRIRHSSADMLTFYQKTQSQTTIFGSVMIILMMVSLSIAIVQFGERMVPAWRGAYLVLMSLFVAVEAIVTRHRTRDMDFRDNFIFHISEWIAFAVITKIMIYVMHGFQQLLIDIPLWQENFVQSFFTGEFMISMLVLLIVWFVSLAYAGEFEDLYNRELDATWDDLGKLQNALHEIRGRIISRVFILGGIIVILAVLTRLDLPEIAGGRGRGMAYISPVINVLFYFLLALILLSQTQFSLLRTRWLWQRLPVSPNLPPNWLKYSILWFFILIIIIAFLPTRYSMSLLDTLRAGAGYLLTVLSFLMVLLTIPFTICAAILSLLGGNQNAQTEAPQSQMFFAAPPVPDQPVAWIEFLRSLLFWVIFLGIIFFALRYYFSQNAALWKIITAFPLARWLSRFFSEVWKWIKGANHQVAVLVKAGVHRLRQQRLPQPVRVVRRLLSFSQMSPRERIIFFYLNLVKLGGERGIERRPSQTPYAYENRLSSSVPDIDADLHRLTDSFLEARYSQHPVDQAQSESAGSLWDHIKAILKSWKQPEKLL